MIGQDAITPRQAEALARLRASGVFDAAWFTVRNPDLHATGVDELTHFHLYGWREARWPNRYYVAPATTGK